MGLRRRSVLLLLSACAAALGAVSVLAAHGVFAARGARRSSSSTPAVPVPKPITPTFRQHLLQLLLFVSSHRRSKRLIILALSLSRLFSLRLPFSFLIQQPSPSLTS